MKNLRTELKAWVRWARDDGQQRWTVALNAPVKPDLLLWLTETYEVEQVKPLGSGGVVLRLVVRRCNVAALMELPKPKWGGSRHECNRVRW